MREATGQGNECDLRIWLADMTYTGHDTQSLGADTFPLAVACIATYTESQIPLTHPIRLFRYPEKIAQALAEDGPPDVMGFSNFVWNSELSLAFARRMKELSPKMTIVFGGANYPFETERQEAFLRNHPAVDFYVVHEGEIAFSEMIKKLYAAGMDRRAVEGTLASVHSLGKNGRLIPYTTKAERIRDLSVIPSPYTTGKLDEFFDGRLWPLIQTKRGCPFTCTFCVEGIDYYTKIGRFAESAVANEIEYIGKKMAVVRANGGRNDLYIADSNFGMYEEDIKTCQALAASRRNYGWPDHINCSTGKNKKERVLEAARILEGHLGLSGSVQSLDPAVLENIKRRNISADQLMGLAKEAENLDANSYCEVILGLPGESLQTHFATLKTIADAGFNKIIPYQLEILSGSELGSGDTITKHQMKLGHRVLPRGFGEYDVEGTRIKSAEIQDVCITTETMSFDDYLECRLMHLIITTFYNDVVFETVLKALRANNVPVFRWLELIRECVKDTSYAQVFDQFREHTGGELWDDRQALANFIQEPGTIERYSRGEIGFNLLYTFKAMSLVDHVDAVIEVVRVSTARLIRENCGENAELLDFFDAATDWDGCRLRHIVHGLDEEVAGTVGYDFARYLADKEPGPVHDYRYQTPRVFRYELNDEQKDYVRRTLSVFGDNPPGIGRLFSTAHTKKMLCNPVPVELHRPSQLFAAV